MKVTAITSNQAKTIFKAVLYSFSAGFAGSFVLQTTDFINAIHNGREALVRLGVSVVSGAVIGGINGVAFTVEKLFTEDK